MLILSSSSTCDICIEHFEIDSTPGKCKPHVLLCGHVFCLGCLNKLPEMRCPLCRTEFDIDSEVYRLRVDLTTEDIVDDSKLSPEDLQARYLENRLLHASEESTPEELHQAAINDAESWLEGKPEHTYQALRSAINVLKRLSVIHDLQKKIDFSNRFSQNSPGAPPASEVEESEQRDLDVPVAASAMLLVDTDWAKIEATTPGLLFCKDPRAPRDEAENLYKNVTFTDNSIMWGSHHREAFEHVEVPFCIIGTTSTIDVKITHGRDRSQLEDHRGEASLRVKNINYRNNMAYGWWSEKLFFNIPIV